jgi:hypothetical protein
MLVDCRLQGLYLAGECSYGTRYWIFVLSLKFRIFHVFDARSNPSNVSRDPSFEAIQISFVHLVSAYKGETWMSFDAPSGRAHRGGGRGSIAMGGTCCFHVQSFGIIF